MGKLPMETLQRGWREPKANDLLRQRILGATELCKADADTEMRSWGYETMQKLQCLAKWDKAQATRWFYDQGEVDQTKGINIKRLRGNRINGDKYIKNTAWLGENGLNQDFSGEREHSRGAPGDWVRTCNQRWPQKRGSDFSRRVWARAGGGGKRAVFPEGLSCPLTNRSRAGRRPQEQTDRQMDGRRKGGSKESKLLDWL